VTRGWLPQRAGPLSLNGGGTAAAVPPKKEDKRIEFQSTYIFHPVAVENI